MSKTYSRNSFDRFGDDLCGHILSYLPIDDKIRCECLSKQWQRVIFDGHTVITVDKSLDNQLMISLVENFSDIIKKCPNVRYLSFDCDYYTNNELLLEVIINSNCPQVTGLHVGYDRFVRWETMQMIFAKFAKQLLSMDLYDLSKYNLMANTDLCARILRIKVNTFYDFIDVFCQPNRRLFPRLRTLIVDDGIDLLGPEWDHFADNYGPLLAHLSVTVYFFCLIDYTKLDNIVQFGSCISRMPVLKSLAIDYCPKVRPFNRYFIERLPTFQDIVDNLHAICRQYRKSPPLDRFSLKVFKSTTDKDREFVVNLVTNRFGLSLINSKSLNDQWIRFTKK